eukprot:3348470-Lingulodinium_polyedra.AAC.1
MARARGAVARAGHFTRGTANGQQQTANRGQTQKRGPFKKCSLVALVSLAPACVASLHRDGAFLIQCVPAFLL